MHGGPPPPGWDCGKWFDPQGFAEVCFGLWQAVETEPLCLGVLVGGRGYDQGKGGASYRSQVTSCRLQVAGSGLQVTGRGNDGLRADLSSPKVEKPAAGSGLPSSPKIEKPRR
jgi:hypothetical protein